MNTTAKPEGNGTAVATYDPPRLPYNKGMEAKYGVTVGDWKVLCEMTFPAARTPEAIGMALAYCRNRHLDIFKKPVHIVPVYDSKKRDYVETIWPGIAELRTTAFRTNEYAGASETIFGPDVTTEFGAFIEEYEWDESSRRKRKVAKGAKKLTVTHPAWAQVTVQRLDRTGQPRTYVGPKTYWLETYATRRGDKLEGLPLPPNSMWEKRAYGQLDKCAEAAALRKAFPEELGGIYSAEEMEGQTLNLEADEIQPNKQPAPPTDAPAQIEAKADKPINTAAPDGKQPEKAALPSAAEAGAGETPAGGTRAAPPPPTDAPPADDTVDAEIEEEDASNDAAGSSAPEISEADIETLDTAESDDYLDALERMFGRLTADHDDVDDQWNWLREKIEERHTGPGALFPPDYDAAIEIAEKHANLLGLEAEGE